MRICAALVIALPLIAGCTSAALQRSMVSQASTVMDTEFQMIVDNIAMFECNPDALPWHVRISEGVVQVNDEAGIAGLGIQWGASSNFTRGPQAQRSVTEQWGADAVTNARILKKMQDVYRQAIGLPPEPDPDFFTQALRIKSDLKNRAATARNEQRSTLEEIPSGKPVAENASPSVPAVPDPQDMTDSLGNSAVPWPNFDVPTGWFHVGKKRDVPHGACYVGHHGDRYVWVNQEGLAELSRFSLVILAITNSETRRAINQQLIYAR